MNAFLGIGNTFINYLLVLFIYFLMFLFIKYPKPSLEVGYRKIFFILSIGWAVLMFTGNYLMYRIGFMSFLPWLNNFIHSFLWIGVCLTWLYYCCHERPIIEQIIFFNNYRRIALNEAKMHKLNVITQSIRI